MIPSTYLSQEKPKHNTMRPPGEGGICLDNSGKYKLFDYKNENTNVIANVNA